MSSRFLRDDGVAGFKCLASLGTLLRPSSACARWHELGGLFSFAAPWGGSISMSCAVARHVQGSEKYKKKGKKEKK